MKMKFNGINPWVLWKVYRKEGNTGYFKFWSVMWFSHFIGQSGYSTPASILNYYTLRSVDPTRKNNMNEIVNAVQDQANSIEVKHFALALDKDGKEIRVEINPTTGIAQDIDDAERAMVEKGEQPTVH